MDSDAPTSGQPPMTFELQRLPYWSPGLVLFAGIVGMFTVWFGAWVLQAILLAQAASVIMQAFAGALLCVSLMVAVLLYRRHVRSRPMPPIRFYDAYVELPGLESLAVRRVSYREILSTGARGQPPDADLLVETRRRVYVYPFAAFCDPTDLERTAAEVSRRLIELPEGKALMEQAERRRALAMQALTIRPIATQALVGVLAVIYVNQFLTGSLDELLGVVRWGASVPALVYNGELFRLLSASFLHANLVHIALNGLALYVLGSLMERFLGWQRFLILYLASGLAATGASVLVGNALSVGASGAIFGVLGSLAVLNWRYRVELPLGFRQPHRWWIVILGIAVASPLLPLLMPAVLPRIDVAAHVGGLVAGVLLSLGFVPARVPARLASPAGPATYAAAFGLVALCLLGLAQAVMYASRFDAAKQREVLSVLVRDDSLNAMMWNNAAWRLAIDAEAEQEDLRLAERAARRAVEVEPAEDSYRDTLATTLYRLGTLDEAQTEETRQDRLGKLDEAVTEERRIIERARHDSAVARWLRSLAPEGAFWPSQLARFLGARLEAAGPVVQGGTAEDAVSLVLDTAAEQAEALLAVRRPPSSGMMLYAVVTRGTERLGLLRAAIGPDPPETSRFDLAGRTAESLAGPRVGLAVALLDGAPGVVLEAGKVTWKFWPNDPRVDTLP